MSDFTYDKDTIFNKSSRSSAVKEDDLLGEYKTTVIHVYENPKENGIPPLFSYQTEIFDLDVSRVRLKGVEVNYKVINSNNIRREYV